MITITESPAVNSIKADGNDTYLRVNSDAGADFYFKLEIKVNDILFLEKSIGKDENGDAAFNFKNFYDAYFATPLYSPPATTGIVSHTELKVKIEVIIKELSVADDGLSLVSVAPIFYLIKSTKKITGSFTKLDFIGLASQEIYAPFTEGIINVPLILEVATISINILDPHDNYIYQTSQVVNAINIGSLFIRLGQLTIPSFTPYLKVELIPAARTEERLNFYIIDTLNPSYPLKMLRYRNNNGVLLQRYFFGALSEERSFKPNSYTQADKKEITYEVEETANIELNTGNHNRNNKAEFIAVANSTEVLLYNDATWERYTSETKKIDHFIDGVYTYDTVIKLTQRKP